MAEPLTTSAWQIAPSPPKSWRSADALSNLVLNNSVPKIKHTEIPANSALVRIRAAALNARDLMVLAHDPIYTTNNAPNLVPLCDGAGEILAVGEASSWVVGERVCIFPLDAVAMDEGEGLPDLYGAGGKGSYVTDGTLRGEGIFKDADLIRAPQGLSFEEAASLIAAGATAASGLFFGLKPIKKGMTVLTQGTGGVSCFAIQLASSIGATVISTSSTPSKLDLARKLGAHHTINYTTTPNWEKEVLRLTGGKGVDMVIEIAGSSTIEQSLTCVKRGGEVSLVGFLSEGKKSDLVSAIVGGGKTVRGIFGFKREHAEYLLKLVEEHGIRPMIEVFEWEDAVSAFRASMERNMVGKIVIKV